MRKFVLAVLLAVIVLAPALAWGQEELILRPGVTDGQLAEVIKVRGLETRRGWRRLILTGTKVTDAGLVHLKGLTKLEFLDLIFTGVTDAGVASLKEALPNCAIYH